MQRARAMEALRGTVAGFAMHGDDQTEPGAVVLVEDDNATAVYLRPIAGDPIDEARRIDACVRRLRERLGRVRPALAQLRGLLPGTHGMPARPEDVGIAIGNVERALAHARRSVRALVAELAELEDEARELVVRAGGGVVES